MKFSSIQVKGKGRGRLLGFPTINLEIPNDLKMDDGIYAAKVFIENQAFSGALHYGPIPTFDEKAKTLEVFLIDVENENIPSSDNFEIEIVKFLRPVLNFETESDLIKQMQIDVESSKVALNSSLLQE